VKLIDEIIEMATDSTRGLADALRKCLVLAFELKNETLKKWVEGELNGFDGDEEIPDYRKVVLHSKGTFSRPFGSGIKNAPLPVLSVLREEHLDLLTSKMLQAIGAYESAARSGNDGTIPWPPDLTVMYQTSFYQGYALASAWQVVPNSILVGLCEEVRNRLLRFSLEIREELGRVEDKPSELPANKVQAAVINHIYGGTNVIANTASNFAQVGSVVVAGDLASLRAALKGANVPDAEASELEKAVKGDEGLGSERKRGFRKWRREGRRSG
jgi:hypothetical protein